MSKRRPPDDEGQRLWRLVASTVTGRAPEKALKMRDKARIRTGKADLLGHAAEIEPPTRLVSVAPLRIDPADIPALKPKAAPKPPPEGIEPNRRRRIIKAHDPIGARLDMHGLDQDRARATLESFIRRAFDDGHRAVLVITGKGKVGHGVLRQRTPEWLAAPALREMIAGVSPADQRHGGEGALYVALKRKG